MDIVEFCEQIRTTEMAIDFLKNRRIIRTLAPRCSTCRGNMTQIRDASFALDGYVWRCPKHKGCKKSIRTNSLIENAHIHLKTFVQLAYFWALSIPSTTQEILCNVSTPTVIEFNQIFRDICSRWLIAHPIRLGGVGSIVQIG